MNPWVMTIKAELVLGLFDPGVKRAIVATETHGKHKLILSGVPEKERPFGLVFQLFLGLYVQEKKGDHKDVSK